jgi:hypothetical protein
VSHLPVELFQVQPFCIQSAFEVFDAHIFVGVLASHFPVDEFHEQPFNIHSHLPVYFIHPLFGAGVGVSQFLEYPSSLNALHLGLPGIGVEFQ